VRGEARAGLVHLPLILLAPALLIAPACGKKGSDSTVKTARDHSKKAQNHGKKDRTAAKKPETAGAAAADPAKGSESIDPAASTSATADEIMGERRNRKPAIIGGCAESCATPAKLVGLLFEGFTARDRVDKLRGLFDWSMLEVDGDKKGDRWALMWADLRQRSKRDDEIHAWLKGWASWVDRIEDKHALVAARMNGIGLQPLPGRNDVVAIVFKHPRLRDDATEQSWRLLATRRGYEWLISRIDHAPSKRPLRNVPRGSESANRI